VLREVVESAARGAGGGTVLLGDAGTGKSRLLAEVRARARERGVQVLHGRMLEGAVAAPFGPFAEAGAGALRSGWPKDTALRPARPLLSRLAGDHVPGPAPSPLALAEALLRLLNALARTGGAALLVEDLLWADSDTVVVLDHLLANFADHRPPRPLQPHRPGGAAERASKPGSPFTSSTPPSSASREINRPPKQRAATAPSPHRRSDDHLTTRHQAECDRDVVPTTDLQPSRTDAEPARTAQRAWSRP
jgi:hypothetical protein